MESDETSKITEESYPEIPIDVSTMDREQVTKMLTNIIKKVNSTFRYGSHADLHTRKNALTGLALLSDGVLKREDGERILIKAICDTYLYYQPVFCIDSGWLQGKKIDDPRYFSSKSVLKETTEYIHKYLQDAIPAGTDVDPRSLLAMDYSEKIKDFFSKSFEGLRKLGESAFKNAEGYSENIKSLKNYTFENDTGISKSEEDFYNNMHELEKKASLDMSIYNMIDRLSNSR